MNEEHRNMRGRSLGRLGLLLALCLAGLVLARMSSGQPGQPNPAPKQENTNCIVTNITTSCLTDGSVALKPVTGQTNFCLGDTITMSTDKLITTGKVRVVTSYSNCPPTTVTNNAPVPHLVANWWAVSGVGAIPSSGSGLSAAFMPTNAGVGNVTFYQRWRNVAPCNTNVQEVNVSTNFAVLGVAALTADQGTAPNGPTNLVCWASNGVVTITATPTPNLAGPYLPGCWSLTGGAVSNKLVTTVDKIIPGVTTVIAASGVSSKTNTIVVVKLSLSPTNFVTCVGVTNTFTADGAPPGEIYTWSPAGVVSPDGTVNQVVFTSPTTNQTVTVACGPCSVTITGRVYSLTLSPTNFVTPAGVTNRLVAVGQPPGLVYNWSAGSSTGSINHTAFSNPTTNQPLTVSYGPCTNTAIGTIFTLSLSNVTFSGALHSVLKDDGSGAYPVPHWTTATNYPVCYTRNTKFTVAAVFAILPAGYSGGVRIRAEGPDGMKPPDVVASASGGVLSFPATEADMPFPDKVNFYNKMNLSWKCAGPSGTNFTGAGTSLNQVYVTLADPISVLYHTVVDVACRNAVGKSAATDVVNGIWDDFAGPIPGVLSFKGVEMKYWPDGYSTPKYFDTA